MQGREKVFPFLFKLVSLAAGLSWEKNDTLNKVYSFIITLLKIHTLITEMRLLLLKSNQKSYENFLNFYPGTREQLISENKFEEVIGNKNKAAF